MIEDHSRSWTHQWKAEGWKAGLSEGRQVGLEEGRQEGRRVGIKEGIKEGAGTVVQRLLQRKFGAIPPAVQHKIKTATSEQLEAWSLNILDATTLDEVFRD